MRFRWLIYTYLLLSTNVLWADTIEVQQSFTKEIVTTHFQILTDTTLHLIFHEVLESHDFQPIKTDFVNQGIVKEHFWFRGQLYSNVEQEVYIEIPQPHINRIQGYFISNLSGEVDSTAFFGDYLPFDQRPYPHRNLVFPIHLDSNETKTVYLFVDRKGEHLNISINLWKKDAFEKEDKSSLTFYGLIFGWQLLYLVWIGVLGAILRQRMIWYYLVFIGFVFFYNLINSGLIYQFVWCNVNGGYGGLLFQFSIFGIGLGLLLFNQQFFKTKTEFKTIHRIFNIALVLMLLLNVPHYFIILLSKNFAAWYQQLVIMSFSLFYLILGLSFILCAILPFLAYRKKRSRGSLLFIISYSFYGVYIGLMVLGALGVDLDIYDYLNHQNTALSLMIEITIFTIAVFLRVYSLNEERKRLALEVTEAKLETAQAKLDGQAIERKRISRDLHDNVGAQLTNIIYSLNIIEYQAANKKIDAVTENVNALEEKVQNTTQLLRDTIWAINQDSFTIPEFYQKISQYLQSYLSENENLDFKIEIIGNQRVELTSSQALHLFRILQEALQNTVKYANASLFLVQLHVENQTLKFILEDNGIGMETTEQIDDEHYGLLNMQERAKEINAIFEMKTAKQVGVTIIITLPLQ